MKNNKKSKNKTDHNIILKLDNSEEIKILDIENVVDPDDEYNELYEDSEKIYQYDFTYVFNLDGMPTSRRVTGSSNEVTYYYYY